MEKDKTNQGNKMSEDRDKVEAGAIKAIEENKLVFIGEIIPYIPIAKSTFYDWGLEKSDNIRAALHNNRVDTKVKLRAQMFDSGNTSDRAMLYKLCGTQEERDILNNKQIIEIKSKSDDGLTDEEKSIALEAVLNHRGKDKSN